MCSEFLFDGANRGILLIDHAMSGALFRNCTKCAQRVAFNYEGILTEKNHFLSEPLNHKIIQFMESGIGTKFVDEATEKSSVRPEKSGPVVLTLEHLGISFWIVLLFLLISFVFFLLELVASRCRHNFAR